MPRQSLVSEDMDSIVNEKLIAEFNQHNVVQYDDNDQFGTILYGIDDSLNDDECLELLLSRPQTPAKKS